MNAEDRASLARADQLAREITDREWLELGVTQEELDQSRLITQQMNAALGQGYTMDEVLAMFDCVPSEECAEQADRIGVPAGDACKSATLPSLNPTQ